MIPESGFHQRELLTTIAMVVVPRQDDDRWHVIAVTSGHGEG